MWSLVRLVLLCDESFRKKKRLQYKRNFPSVYRVSQKFVPLITGDITFDRNYTSAWNFLTTFIALLSTYIRKFNVRHALLCLLSRFEAVAAWNGVSHVAWRAGFSSRLVWAVFSDPSWFKELGLYRQLHPLCSKDSLQGWYLGIWGPACFLYKIWQVFFAPCLGGLGCVCWRPVLDERHVAIGAEQFSLVCCFIHIYGEGQASLLSLMCCLCSNRQSKSVLGVMNVFQWDRGLSSRPIWSTLNFF